MSHRCPAHTIFLNAKFIMTQSNGEEADEKDYKRA
jgi:hypothetical protein